MDRSQPRRPTTPTSGPDDILRELSARQHLRPHRPVGEALADATAALGLCPAAADRAMAWLELSPGVAIGRLTRTQLAQLARSLDRIWRRAAGGQPAPAPQPM